MSHLSVSRFHANLTQHFTIFYSEIHQQIETNLAQSFLGGDTLFKLEYIIVYRVQYLKFLPVIVLKGHVSKLYIFSNRNTKTSIIKKNSPKSNIFSDLKHDRDITVLCSMKIHKKNIVFCLKNLIGLLGNMIPGVHPARAPPKIGKNMIFLA